MDLAVKDKVAIVTGAGKGIGAETARRFGREGVNVVVADISKTDAVNVADEIRRAGANALAIEVDVTDESAVKKMVEAVAAEFGAIHILINNAGLTRDMRIGKMALADWDIVIDVVLKGAFLCSRAVLPLMAEQAWGRIVNISSRAHLGNPGQVNYSSAKAGLLGFTRALSMEQGQHGVTVNAVAPGLISTEMVRSLPHFDKIVAAAEKNTPLKRLGDACDVADAILFLSSERSAYITGEVLHVTGGRYG